MGTGLPPTERNERTGLLTPPGNSPAAAVRTPALSMRGGPFARVCVEGGEVGLAQKVPRFFECREGNPRVGGRRSRRFIFPERRLSAQRDEHTARLRAGYLRGAAPLAVPHRDAHALAAEQPRRQRADRLDRPFEGQRRAGLNLPAFREGLRARERPVAPICIHPDTTAEGVFVRRKCLVRNPGATDGATVPFP